MNTKENTVKNTQHADRLCKAAKIAAVLITLVTINFASVTALLHLAYWERGYMAVGGEWLLILVIAVVSCRLALKVMNKF